MAEFGESLDNVVEYKIFSIHSAIAEIDNILKIEDVLYDVLSYAQSLISDYIWQNDCFNLTTQDLEQPRESIDKSEQSQFLKGSTNFGDNIEDEWFIVYLLFSISKQFPDFAITVNDNDGEFLLIEAAEYLPEWLEPDTSENRVFVYQGKLHIIPFPKKPSEIPFLPAGKPTICQALKILKANPEKTVAPPWIQDPILKKIQEYPKKARGCFHNVLCYVPPKVKYLLETKNSLISPAVSAFVNRDLARTGQSLVHFNLKSLVPCRVRFTKCLYGQLVKQNFIRDKYAMKFMPAVSCPTYKGHLIGLQLTYGFEVLYNQTPYNNGMVSNNTAGGECWEKYLESLTKHGYFREEVVGSQLYTQLMENAKEYFTKICLNSGQNQHSINEIKTLLKDVPIDEKVSPQSTAEVFPPDDNESWLEVTTEELDFMLSQYGQSKLTGEEVDLREVVSGMNSFVEKISSYEGAEFPSDQDEDDIQFDAEGFMKSVDTIFMPSNTDNSEIISDDLNDSGDSDEEMVEYATAMDNELSATNIGKSFVKLQSKDGDLQRSKIDESSLETEDDTMKPVDIDLNLVQNFLESYSLQQGSPGPVSNILSSIGITLPENLPQADE
ncbi:protein ecdysoneless homolog [Dendronephthya gigantea]|uniref:protein ecdysoneless homolog n=1 Tax=Dendronephthya gigantea TaxID=151771 RepID=UPI00106D4300|nr:protein ecdysoneless homolog [Dendronephthya gigantea]